MPQILLTFHGAMDDRDIAVEFDDRTLVGQVADRLAAEVGREFEGARLTLERVSRGTANLDRDDRVSRQDLRSGDVVRLAHDTGLRGVVRSDSAGDLIVTAGSGTGQKIPLRRGVMTIGRDSSCDVTIDDPLASRQHAQLTVSDVVEIADLGSTNGVLIAGQLITQPRRLAHGDRMLIGDTELAIDLSTATPTELHQATSLVEFNRPPRVVHPFAGAEIELPIPPDNPPKQRLPMITALVPILMGVGLYFLTRNIASVAFIAMSPLLVVGSWWENKRSGRADHVQRVADFEEDLASVVLDLDQRRTDEVSARMQAAPPASDLLEHATTLSSRLWERQPEDEDFLELRIGLAAQPSRTHVKLRQGGARDRQAELSEIPPRYATLPPVPVTVNMGEVGAIGVGGPPDAARGLTRSLLTQAAALESPSELVVAALLSPDEAPAWDWLKWLPHVRSPLSPIEGAHLATELDDHLGLIAELTSVIQDRHATAQPGGGRVIHDPHVLLLIDDGISLERARLNTILDHGPANGVSLVWVSNTVRRLPKSCGAIVDISPSGGTADVGFVARQSTIHNSTVETLDAVDAAAVARTLSPVIDVSSRQSGDAEIPRMAALVDLLGGPSIMDTTSAISERWLETLGGHSLRGPVGATSNGVFSLDLRHDGPHGLVAGTTGAGKSEFLQGMLTGLAASHSPSRVTFLLVDYKGGSAFKDVVELPHTVGLVTDLTPALVRRALTSLRAELHRRERLLNEANAKDLVQMEAEQHPKTPPSLIIVVDEFAALAREVPEFVDGVVDVAQRGRSLGLHLMLATQRPAGVVTDNIRANTNLKVALRVASPEESNDVIGSPAAGNLDRTIPGRALARLGPSELIQFQSAYVGGRTSATDDSPTVRVSDFGMNRLEQWAESGTGRASRNGHTDLQRLVVRINEAFTASGADTPRRPWLDPLSSHYDLLRLPRGSGDARLTLGVADDPAHQTQRVVSFAPDQDGSLIVYGASGSGKTVALRTLAASAALAGAATPTHVYGLDFAGRGLEMLEPLPNVGAVIPGDDYERVTRLLAHLNETLTTRAEQFGRTRASSLDEYRRNTGEAVPRILVLLDGHENFHSSYERIDRGQWYELFSRLVADGRGVGLHFAMTGGRRSAFPMALTSAVQRKLVLRMANADEYLSIGVDASLIDGDEGAGRGIDGDDVVQVAMVGSDPSTAGQADAIRALAPVVEQPSDRPQPIAVLADQVPLAAIDRPTPARLTVGLTDRLDTFALPTGDRLLLTGPVRSGKTTAVRTIANQAAAAGRRVVVLAGRRPIDGLSDDIEVAVGPDAIAEIANRGAMPQELVVIIDEFEELFDSPADFPLQTALATDGLTIIAACEATQARRGFSPLLGMLKRSRRTLILLPDSDLDGDLANAPLPRTNRRWVPGRGYFSDGGQLTVVQIAI